MCKLPKQSNLYLVIFIVVAVLVGGFFYFQINKPLDVDFGFGDNVGESTALPEGVVVEEVGGETVIKDEVNKIKIKMDVPMSDLRISKGSYEDEGFIVNTKVGEGITVLISETSETGSLLQLINKKLEKINEVQEIKEVVSDSGLSNEYSYVFTKETGGPWPLYHHLYVRFNDDNRIINFSGYSEEEIKDLLGNIFIF